MSDAQTCPDLNGTQDEVGFKFYLDAGPPLLVMLSQDDAKQVYHAITLAACLHTAETKRRLHELAQRFWIPNDDRFAKPNPA